MDNVNIFETIKLGQDYSVLNSRHTLCLYISLSLCFAFLVHRNCRLAIELEVNFR